MAKMRPGSATHVVDEHNNILNLPTSSPAGTPADDLGTVQGAPIGYPVSVVGKSTHITVELTLDTAIYADDDVLAATQIIPGAFREAGGRSYVHSITVLDEDDQGVGLDLYFLNAELSIGTENSALAITDQSARAMLGGGVVSVSAADFIDMGGSRLATKTNVGLMLQAAGGMTNLYIGAVSQGTGTYASGRLRLGLGLMFD